MSALRRRFPRTFYIGRHRPGQHRPVDPWQPHPLFYELAPVSHR